jgi:hypothetical protein
MHPHLLYQLAAARNDEIRQAAAGVSATRQARSALRPWSRWLRHLSTPPTRWSPGARSRRDCDPLKRTTHHPDKQVRRTQAEAESMSQRDARRRAWSAS